MINWYKIEYLVLVDISESIYKKDLIKIIELWLNVKNAAIIFSTTLYNLFVEKLHLDKQEGSFRIKYLIRFHVIIFFLPRQLHFWLILPTNCYFFQRRHI